MTPHALLTAALVSAIVEGVFFVAAVHALTNDEIAPGGHGALALGVLSDDNLTRVESNEQSDIAIFIAPSVRYSLLFGKHQAAFSYLGNYASYRDNPNEDYRDHNVEADLALDLTERLSVNAGVGVERSHDLRGASGSSNIISAGPDEWKESDIFAETTYGRRTSKGQISLLANAGRREYTNNDQGTRDRDSNRLSATFFYNLTAKTSWLFEIRTDDIDNVGPASINVDSRENRYLLGARWEATGLSRGEIRMGYLKKNLDNNSAEDFDGFTLEGIVELNARAQDNFVLTALRQTNESAEITANFFVSTEFGAAWQHSFTDLWNGQFSVSVQEDKFSGSSRIDDLTSINISTEYDLSERINVNVNYGLTKRDSNSTGLNYDNNTLMLTLIMQPG